MTYSIWHFSRSLMVVEEGAMQEQIILDRDKSRFKDPKEGGNWHIQGSVSGVL